MNWFTKGYVAMVSTAEKKELVETWGGCEHVIADSSVLTHVSYECDSFGREGFCLCEVCHTAQEEAVDNATESCNDCGKLLPRKELYCWTPYDYYPAQGDEPTMVCPACLKLSKHQSRVACDNADREWEFGSDDDDTDYAD